MEFKLLLKTEIGAFHRKFKIIWKIKISIATKFLIIWVRYLYFNIYV